MKNKKIGNHFFSGSNTIRWCLCAGIFLCICQGAAYAQIYLPTESFSRDQLSAAQSSEPVVSIPKLETPLSELYLNRNQPVELSSQLSSQLGAYLVESGVRVVIVAENESFVLALKEAVGAAGGDLVAAFGNRIEVIVPVEVLKTLSELDGVLYIRRPLPVYPMEPNSGVEQSTAESLASTGTSVTQGVNASRANLWHAKNITGAGVKVAVLDFFKDYTVAQARGELPSSITRHGTLDTTSTRHGTAVAEIIYDMAPGARMTFATPNSATQMAQYIVDLAKVNNKVISSSMLYYLDEPGDGTGAVSSAINTATNTYGSLYCQAAGNQALYHWDGNYAADQYGYHDYGGGANINQLGRLPANTPINLFLRWNDWPVSNQNYDLLLVYSDGPSPWAIAASSENIQNGSQPPTESITIVTGVDGYWGFVIDGLGSTSNKVLDIMGHNAPSFQFNKRSRSLVDPATAGRSFSVAAVDVSTYARESYSSVGPAHGPGGALTGGRAKPRIAGFANVDTWTYGPGVFNGTSSATPHVAGAAALVRYAFPGYSPAQVMQFLESKSVDQGTGGYDYLYGAGRLNLGAAPKVQRALPFLLLLLRK